MLHPPALQPALHFMPAVFPPSHALPRHFAQPPAPQVRARAATRSPPHAAPQQPRRCGAQRARRADPQVNCTFLPNKPHPRGRRAMLSARLCSCAPAVVRRAQPGGLHAVTARARGTDQQLAQAAARRTTAYRTVACVASPAVALCAQPRCHRHGAFQLTGCVHAQRAWRFLGCS